MKGKIKVREIFRLSLPILMYLPIYGIWFSLLEKHRFSHYALIHTTLDDKIPFCEVFIIPYVLWFLYVSGTVLYFLFNMDVEDYFKDFMFLVAGMTLFLLISTVFPNMHQLRPAVMPRDNIFTHMIANLYKADTPTNLWPSIHVYNSIGTMIAVRHSKRIKKAGKIFSDILGVSIILSTMFIKQHSIYDVLTAIFMAVIFYLVFYHSTVVESFCKKREEKLAFRYE